MQGINTEREHGLRNEGKSTLHSQLYSSDRNTARCEKHTTFTKTSVLGAARGKSGKWHWGPALEGFRGPTRHRPGRSGDWSQDEKDKFEMIKVE